MSKTVSSRLQDSKHEVLREKCNQLGCSMNDFIKDAIEMKLNGHKTESVEDEILNCDCCDDNVKEMNMKIIKNVHNCDSSGLTEDDDGTPLSAEIEWNYDEDGGSSRFPVWNPTNKPIPEP